MVSLSMIFSPVVVACATVSAVTLGTSPPYPRKRNLLRERGAHRHLLHSRSIEETLAQAEQRDYDYDDMAASNLVNLSLLTKREGLMTIYTDPYDQQSILMDFTDVLDRNAPMKVLASATYREGTFSEEAGQTTVYHDPVSEDTMIAFTMSDDTKLVDVVRPRLSFRTSDKQAKAAVDEGTWTGWAGSLPRVPNTEDKILVDATNLIAHGFYTNGFPFEQMIAEYRIREVRCFPSNIEVTVAMQISEDGISLVPVVVSFTFLKLPTVPMTPRKGDDRLGYFTVDFMDVGEHEKIPHHRLSDEVDIQHSWIMRYNLTSPHNKGVIRFYVDPTVPERWRPYFKNGVEAWNAAFAEIGHPNAVKAILPGSDDWPEDYDPNDARFSTISWSLDPSEVYALGLAKVDPRSGEIVKSDIIVTAGWVHAWLEELDLEAPTVTHASTGYRREARQLRTRSWQAEEEEVSKAAHDVDSKERRNPFLRNRARLHSPEEQRSAEQAFQFSPMAFAAANAEISEGEWQHIIGLGLGSVVMHETGHSLGARHNFKASTAISAGCLADAKCTKHQGLSASIMDYTPINIFAFKKLKDGEERPDLFQTTIGAYDKLLISYGYGDWSWSEGAAILEKAADYPMCTDEDRIYGDDPYCQVHELSSNPLTYYKEKLRMLGFEMKHLLNMSVAAGESYTRYGRAVLSTLNKAMYIGEMASTYIGGISTVHMHRNHDSTHPNQSAATVIPEDMQVDALNMITDIFKGKVAWLFPDDESSRFLEAREGDIGTGAINIRAEKHALQRAMVQVLTDPELLARLYASESHEETGFTIDKLLDTLSNSIWGESGDFLSDSSSWDMQSTFLGELKSMYMSHCERFVPPAVLSKVFRRLQMCKDHVDDRHQTLIRTRDENGAEEAATAAYLTYLKSILSDIDMPCGRKDSVSDGTSGEYMMKRTLSD